MLKPGGRLQVGRGWCALKQGQRQNQCGNGHKRRVSRPRHSRGPSLLANASGESWAVCAAKGRPALLKCGLTQSGLLAGEKPRLGFKSLPWFNEIERLGR